MYEQYEAQLRRRPDDVHALDAYWREACAAGDQARILDWLHGAIATDPEVPGFHYMLGVALQGLVRYDDAHASFREALRLALRAEAQPDAPPPPGPGVPVPATTLCCVDCRNHELAIATLRRSMAQCRFERVVFFTDRRFELPGIEVAVIPDIASIAEYSRFIVKALGDRIESPYALVIQYDGYILNGRCWQAAFHDYDYIGAPWVDGGAHAVGNGGFSLRSRRLLQALRDPRIAELVPEDIAICRTYRRLLEDDYGIRFAPADLAARFSFESVPPSGPTFGFHGIAHMVRIVNMSEEELAAYRPGPAVQYVKK